MKASQAAYKAAEIMSSRGHCKHALEDDDGRVCHQGALLLAYTGQRSLFSSPFLTMPQRHELGEINETGDQILLAQGYDGGVVNYNNQHDTTQEDVILLLKKTARKLEEEGL